MPTVDVMTGDITPSGAQIEIGTQFEWTCNGHGLPSGTSITVDAVHMPGGEPWFETSTGSGSVQFYTPNASASVTAEGDGDWTWTAIGVNVDQGAHVIVEPTIPKDARKAS